MRFLQVLLCLIAHMGVVHATSAYLDNHHSGLSMMLMLAAKLSISTVILVFGMNQLRTEISASRSGRCSAFTTLPFDIKTTNLLILLATFYTLCVRSRPLPREVVIIFPFFKASVLVAECFTTISRWLHIMLFTNQRGKIVVKWATRTISLVTHDIMLFTNQLGNVNDSPA